MGDREAFVSRLILEAETPLERAAVTELQIAGLELERLRAIVCDLAESNPYEGEYGMCVLCLTDPPSIAENVNHAPGCPWLRATQEVQP